MERIDLYDKYINDQLSDKERDEFDARLKSDKEFASDFKIYLFTVDGVCLEAHQDNLDFGLAMKSLSKDKLKEIIGKQDVASQVAASAECKSEIVKPKVIRFKPWIWQVASIAAVVIIAFTIVFRACLKTIVNGSEFPESNYHSSHHEHFIGRICCFLVISA